MGGGGRGRGPGAPPSLSSDPQALASGAHPVPWFPHLHRDLIFSGFVLPDLHLLPRGQGGPGHSPDGDLALGQISFWLLTCPVTLDTLLSL